MARKSLLRRFMDKVRSDWQWMAGRNKKGYGIFHAPGSSTMAHRASYELFVGPVPDGMLVLHSCDDPGCVNPDCLHLGTNLINMQEKREKGRERYSHLILVGEDHRNAKLREEDVREIRRLFDEKEKSQHKIAEQFGIHVMTVNHIVHRKSWKHLY